MDSFTQLASKFSIKSSHIDHLLHFLHFRIDIIQHYNADTLSDIVTQVLFNKITDFLVKTFLTSEALKTDQLTSFRQKGILKASVLETIMGGNEDKLNPKQYFAFIVHLHLAVPLKDKFGVQHSFCIESCSKVSL